MIIVSGSNTYSQLGEKSNNRNSNGTPIINPPVKLKVSASSISSFSTYFDHTVFITKDSSINAIGDNRQGEISPSIQKRIYKRITKFELKDSQNRQYKPLSVVCGESYTLYIASNASKNHLIFSSSEINGQLPLFLNTGKEKPVTVFGGCSKCGSITADGKLIFIPRNICISPNGQIDSISLPDNEKAVKIAFNRSSIFVLSSNGYVYCSQFSETDRNNDFSFQKVVELRGIKIESISGTYDHCFAVSNNGRVYGCGSNSFGQLGVNRGRQHVGGFIQIISFGKRKIKEAFAGCSHSLFITNENAVLACGSNEGGELLMYTEPSNECVYIPTLTTIVNGAKFCIAGNASSVVFKSKECEILTEKQSKPETTRKVTMIKKKIAIVRSVNQAEKLRKIEEENKALRDEILFLKKERSNYIHSLDIGKKKKAPIKDKNKDKEKDKNEDKEEEKGKEKDENENENEEKVQKIIDSTIEKKKI